MDGLLGHVGPVPGEELEIASITAGGNLWTGDGGMLNCRARGPAGEVRAHVLFGLRGTDLALQVRACQGVSCAERLGEGMGEKPTMAWSWPSRASSQAGPCTLYIPATGRQPARPRLMDGTGAGERGG